MENSEMGVHVNVPITSSIPEDLYREAKAKHWKWQEIFIAGIQAKKEYPAILQRLGDLEADKKKLAERLQHYAYKVQDQDLEIERLKKGVQ